VVHTGVIAPESAYADNRYCGNVPERQIILLMIETADRESRNLATGLNGPRSHEVTMRAPV